MKRNPFEIVQWFEEEVAEYTGAPYAVATNSCTNALFLSCLCTGVEGKKVTIPARTYLSVPQSIIQAGGEVEFKEMDWQGIYQLSPFPIYDAAKRLTSGMYIPGTMMCLSFHHKKHLKIGKGGMILCGYKSQAEELKKLRYEGRSIGVPYAVDELGEGGYNMYMTPEEAARGMTLLSDLPKHTLDLIEDPPYRDLRTFKLFQ